MGDHPALDEYLEGWAKTGDLHRAVASTLAEVAGACREIAALVSTGSRVDDLAGRKRESVGGTRTGASRCYCVRGNGGASAT
jgi:hypothetical protein